MLIVIYLVLLKFLVNFGKFSEDAAFVPVSLKKAVVSVENGISYFLKDAIAFCRFSKNSFLFLDATHFYLNLRRCDAISPCW